MSFDINKHKSWKEYMNALRKHKFASGYKPKHQILFDYHYFDDDKKEEFLKQYIHPDMYWVEKNKEWNFAIEEPIWEVYQFPVFKKKLCDMIVDEVEHFNCFLGKDDGPNRYKPYTTTETWLNSIPGTLDIDIAPLGYFYRSIQKIYVKPILYEAWKFKPRDMYNSWVSRYRQDEQKYLEYHIDEATCASIVSLNDDYKGGGTIFERQRKIIDREAGWCTIHPSKLTHRHAGRRVTEGKRFIIVTFID